jgi:hypothetical protein
LKLHNWLAQQLLFREALKNLGGDALARQFFKASLGSCLNSTALINAARLMPRNGESLIEFCGKIFCAVIRACAAMTINLFRAKAC